jgi:hypothetical protein
MGRRREKPFWANRGRVSPPAAFKPPKCSLHREAREKSLDCPDCVDEEMHRQMLTTIGEVMRGEA